MVAAVGIARKPGRGHYHMRQGIPLRFVVPPAGGNESGQDSGGLRCHLGRNIVMMCGQRCRQGHRGASDELSEGQLNSRIVVHHPPVYNARLNRAYLFVRVIKQFNVVHS